MLTILAVTANQVLAGNLVEEAETAGLTTLLQLVKDAGLEDALTDPDTELTVFAPTNQAFEALGEEVLAELAADPERLKSILLYHVTAGAVKAEDIQNDVLVDSLATMTDENGEEVTLKLRGNKYLESDFYDGFITVNGKRVNTANIPADNGIVHVVSEVFYPIPTETIAGVASNDQRFSTLLELVTAAGLAETLSDPAATFTVFAPTNDAFAKLDEDTLNSLKEDTEGLKNVLLGHVLPSTFFRKGISWMTHDTAAGTQIQTQVFKGGIIKVASSKDKSAKVIDYDLIATNGVIHVLDNVI